MDERQLRDEFRRYFTGKDFEFKAVLGRADGTVKESGTNVYVTLHNGEVITVFNGRVPNKPLRKVIIGYDDDYPGLLQVLRFDNVYSSPPLTYTPNHKDSHTWFSHDPIDVYAEQFYPLLARAAGGLIVRVYGGAYYANGSNHILPTNDYDLSGEAVSSGAEWVNLEADENGAVTYQHGANYDNRELLLPEHIPATTADKKLLCSIKMYGGQSEIVQVPGNTDIFDPRFTGESSGTPGGSDTEIQVNDGGVFAGYDTFKRQANGAVIIGDIDPALSIEAFSLGQGADGTSIANFLETFGTGVASYIALLRARGTHDAPTAIMDDDVIGRIRGRGHDGTGWSSTRAELRFVADGNWAAGDHPTRIELWTCPDDSDVLTLAMTIGRDGSITLPEYGGGAKTGTATYGLGVDAGGNIIETSASGASIPIVTSDPVSPADGELWLLRETTGAIADGTPIGLLLALTYTDNAGATAPLQLSVWDDVTSQIIRY